MFNISVHDIKKLSIGALLLGSGGGGHTKILSALVEKQIDKYGCAEVISTNDLDKNCVVVPIAFVGAPLVMVEKIPNILSFESLLFQIRSDYPDKKIVLMPAEIGGCNALTPLLLASKYKIPLLDADLIGRAFPKMPMCKPAVLGYSPNPTYISNSKGECTTLLSGCINEVEESARNLAVDFGSYIAVSTFIFSNDNIEKIKQYIIEGSYSQALSIGNCLISNQGDIHMIAGLLSSNVITQGNIDDIFHSIDGGFLKGCVKVRTKNNEVISIHFENEFLLIAQGSNVLAESPTIISILDAKTMIPITAESLRYGFDVIILSTKPPLFWENTIARELVSFKV